MFLAVIAFGLVACDDYEIANMKSYLQAGEWADNENGAILSFRDDDLYVWKFSYDGKFENDFHESFVRGLLASKCENMDAYEAPDLSVIIENCDLPSDSGEISVPGWTVFSDKSYAIIDKYEIINNTLYVDSMGDRLKVKIKAESETQFSYTDDVDTYHFSR